MVIMVLSMVFAPSTAALQVENAPIVYTVIDLGPLTHPNQDECFDQAPGATITDIGIGNRAVGSVYQEDERAVAAILSTAGPRKMESGPGGGRANAINGSGQIAGTLFAQLPVEQCGEPSGPIPATWNGDFELELLDLPDGSTAGSAVAINQAGIIAGWVETDDGRRAAFWGEDGPIVIKHPLFDGAGSIESESIAINDEGLIAGTVSWLEDGQPRTLAFVWDGVNAQYLDPLLVVNGFAASINNSGVVAGAVVDEAGVRSPVLWWRGQIVMLGKLDDRPHAVATDINNAGFAVGFGEREDGLTRAMIWIGGAPVDLNSITPDESGWQLQMAVGINDDGVIAGWGDLDGERRAFLLVPASG
jgi:uncharacterized membrane protein